MVKDFESLMDAIASPFQLEGTDQQLINSKRFCGLFHPLSMYLLIIVFELKRCPIGPCVCHTLTSKRSRLLIGPARLPLLIVVVMSPAAAATMKHFLAPHAGPVY